jgi:hypothetical protein
LRIPGEALAATRPRRGEMILSNSIKQHLISSLVVAIWSVAGATANADIVCDRNPTAEDIVMASKPPAGIFYRTMAIVQSAVWPFLPRSGR